MSTSATPIAELERRVDAALGAPAIALLLRTQLVRGLSVPTADALRAAARADLLGDTPPGDLAAAAHRAITRALAPHSVAYAEALAVLEDDMTRGFVRRSVPASEIDDVLSDAGARVWSALRRGLPDNGAAFAMAVVKIAIADARRRAARRGPTASLTTAEGAVIDVPDHAAMRALDRLIEVDAVHEVLDDLRRRGATPLELQRLLAMVLADGNATAAAALLPEPVRSGALNQSITSLRRRVDR